MNVLAFSFLALWQADLSPVLHEPVIIPVAAMVRNQREAAVNDIRLWIQADLERSTARLLKQKRSPRNPGRQAATLADTTACMKINECVAGAL